MGRKRVKLRQQPGPNWMIVMTMGVVATVLATLFALWKDLAPDPPPSPGYRPVSLLDLGSFQVAAPQTPMNILRQPLPGEKMAPVAIPTRTVFPDRIQALDGAEVVVPGYMLPYDLDGQHRVVNFFLIRSTMTCCFGRPPRLNEVVRCETAPGVPAEFMNNVPLRVYGKLLVGEVFNGRNVQALYRLKVERIEGLKRPDSSMIPALPALGAPIYKP